MALGNTAPAFFDKTYNEALELTEQAYVYLSEIQQNGLSEAVSNDDLRLRGEAFRLTTRLMQVVAWLLTQRAVHAGELSVEEVVQGDRYRLSAAGVCHDDSQHNHPVIPSEMTEMLDQSLNLYVRVERLDGMMHRSIH